MIQCNAMVLGWDKAVTGREGLASELFSQCVTWFDRWKASGAIEAWEPLWMASHGGDLNGMFTLRGTQAQLSALRATDEWVDLVMRAGQCLTSVGVVEAWAGKPFQDVMLRWTKSIPTR